MNRRKFFIPAAAGTLASAQRGTFLAPAFAQTALSMSAITVLVIRHAEKPNGSWPGPGLAPNGEKDKKSLVIRGWQRAGAWATLFGAGIEIGGTYPVPARIYAADPANAEEKGTEPTSVRNYQAARRSSQADADHALGDEGKIVADINGFSGVALVCGNIGRSSPACCQLFSSGSGFRTCRQSGTVSALMSCCGSPDQLGGSVVVPPAVSAAVTGGQQRAGAVPSLIRPLTSLVPRRQQHGAQTAR
jgi:hypothetical protein